MHQTLRHDYARVTNDHARVRAHAPGQTLDEKGEGVFAFVIGEKNRKGNVPSVALVAPGADGKVLKYL